MAVQTTSEPLEQRLVELQSTFCDAPDTDHAAGTCDHEESRQLPHAEEQKFNIIVRKNRLFITVDAIELMCGLENLAFLIRAQDDKHNGGIKCGDVFVTILGWESYCEGLDDATLAVLVRTAKTTKVLQIRVVALRYVSPRLGQSSDSPMRCIQLLESERQNKVVETRFSSNKVRVIRGGWLQPLHRISD